MGSDKEKLRLDNLLVERGFFVSRSRARDAVLRGTVQIDGVKADKAGLLVPFDTVITVEDAARPYVSRAALKLRTALDGFKLDIVGATAVDIGSSTGGFCQVLLERGVQSVVAVDVGTGQLHESLRRDKRIKLYEGLNARALTVEHFRDREGNIHLPNFIVSDVSFISLKLALPPVLKLAAKGAKSVLLVKPQFEAGRENIGKGGLLKDKVQGENIAQDLYQWLDCQPHWRACGLLPSPIKGMNGNQEFLLYGEKQENR